jgi:hypothetical protein
VALEILTIPITELPKALGARVDPDLLLNRAVFAHLSHYQKILPRSWSEALDAHAADLARSLRSDPSFDNWDVLRGLTAEEQRVIFRSVGAWAPTFGCNGGCRGCGFDAVAGVRDVTPYPVLEEGIRRHANEISLAQPFFYFASDLMDYPHAKELMGAVREYCGYSPYVATFLPNPSLGAAEEYLKSGAPLDRVSMTGRSSHSQKRKLFELPVVAEHQTAIDWGNVSAFDAAKGRLWNFDTPWQSESGIGCFWGVLLTPRGVYSVAQMPAASTDAPQRQFVIPFVGGATRSPRIGDDMRVLLATHVPLPDATLRTFPLKTPAGTSYVPATCFVIGVDPSDENLQAVYRIDYVGATVTDVRKESGLGAQWLLNAPDLSTLPPIKGIHFENYSHAMGV